MTTKWILENVPEGFPILNLNLQLFTVNIMGIMILCNIFGKVKLFMQNVDKIVFFITQLRNKHNNIVLRNTHNILLSRRLPHTPESTKHMNI